ncbi:hypothetical protein BKA69DRAFT_205180 [Paraphysoderma sedebokerense]|nr:hypothetical protein BKA69DRAFT_205180 [Paraphysoderma sedebokerense]
MSLIRHSFANYLALWAIFLDAVEFFTLIVSIPDEWLENSLAGAAQVLKTLRIGPAYGWYHALGFVLISIWLLYGIIFLQPKLVSSLQTKAPYLLAPGPILLPILATVAFLPGIRILLNYVECKYTKNVAFFSYDFEQLCFNDQHMIWLIISVFLAVLYVPFIMYFCGVWQELQEELDIKYDIHMLVYQNFAKLFLSLFIVVQPREPTAYLVVHSVTYASLTVYVLRANPTKVTWAPIWKSAGFIVSFWSSIVCLIAHYQAQKNDIWPWILIAAGFFVILLSAYLIHRRKFTTRVFIPKPNAQKKDKVSKMMRLFKAKGNMGSKGSSSMNSSGSLGSANPEMNKMFQTTVPNWIVRFQLDNKIDQETAEYLLREITESNPLLAEMFFRADGNEENFYKVLFTLRGIEILRLPRPHVRRNSSSSDTRGGPAVGDVIRTGAILDNVEGATRPKESHKVPKLDELKEEGEEEESEASVPKL